MNSARRVSLVARFSCLRHVVAVGLTLWALCVPARAQFTQGMKISNFSASDPFPAPHYKQMRYVVTGVEGRPQSDKTFLLTGLQLKTFKVNGENEMTVDAPECIFNDKARTAQSAGKLMLQSGDGKLRVEGVGFGCQLAQKILIISNDVTAIIVRPNTNANAAPLVIKSRWLEFDAEKRRAIFHDDVRGDDPDFSFTCGSLIVSAADTNQSSFDLIEARDSLVVIGKAGGQRASADRGVYRSAEASVELIGQATWDVEGKSGRADHVIGLRTNGSIQAEGNVAMKLPRAAMGAATGLLSSSNKLSHSASMIDVFADKFLWQSNAITGTTITGIGSVRIVDATNGVSFSCDKLEARQATNPTEDETAVATGNVKVTRAGANVLANRADYSKRAGAVVFTGNPHWRHAQIEGNADRVTFKTVNEEIEADKNVAVKITLPAKGGSSPLALFPQPTTNQTAQVIDITSERLNVTERKAVFLGKVNANQSPRTGSEARLKSDMLEVLFTAQTNRLEAITATGNVLYEQGTIGLTNGPAIYRKMTCRSLAAKTDAASGEPVELVAAGGVHLEQPGMDARAEQAIYNRKLDALRFVGQPVIEMPQGTYTSNRELQVAGLNRPPGDKARHTVTGSDYKITVKPEVLKQAEESQKLPRP